MLLTGARCSPLAHFRNVGKLFNTLAALASIVEDALSDLVTDGLAFDTYEDVPFLTVNLSLFFSVGEPAPRGKMIERK